MAKYSIAIILFFLSAAAQSEIIDPASLFANSENGYYVELGRSQLASETDGTGVVVNLGSVGYIEDLSGNGNNLEQPYAALKAGYDEATESLKMGEVIGGASVNGKIFFHNTVELQDYTTIIVRKNPYRQIGTVNNIYGGGDSMHFTYAFGGNYYDTLREGSNAKIQVDIPGTITSGSDWQRSLVLGGGLSTFDNVNINTLETTRSGTVHSYYHNGQFIFSGDEAGKQYQAVSPDNVMPINHFGGRPLINPSIPAFQFVNFPALGNFNAMFVIDRVLTASERTGIYQYFCSKGWVPDCTLDGYDVTLTFSPSGQERPEGEVFTAVSTVDVGFGPFEYKYKVKNVTTGTVVYQSPNWNTDGETLTVDTTGFMGTEKYRVSVTARDTGNGNKKVRSGKRLLIITP
jgi:hypothetical protein